MKVVIDTNVLIVIIPRLSKFRFVYDAFLKKRFSIALSNEVIFEYQEILTQKSNQIIAESFLKQLIERENVELQQVFFSWNLITMDNSDNKFVDLAIAAGADYIVTEDNHFNTLSTIEFPAVKCINLSNFIKLIGEKP